MNLITAAQAASRWGISPQRVRLLCLQGRIPGAEQKIINGKCTWVMPEQEKPEELKPGVKPTKKPR